MIGSNNNTIEIEQALRLETLVGSPHDPQTEGDTIWPLRPGLQSSKLLLHCWIRLSTRQGEMKAAARFFFPRKPGLTWGT